MRRKTPQGRVTLLLSFGGLVALVLIWSSAGALWCRVAPPEGPRLNEKEVRTLRAWIDEGLAWEPGFSFKARTYVAPPRPPVGRS